MEAVVCVGALCAELCHNVDYVVLVVLYAHECLEHGLKLTQEILDDLHLHLCLHLSCNLGVQLVQHSWIDCRLAELVVFRVTVLHFFHID